nr:hypothetical protein [Mangrovicoccus ximenensis]
MLGGDEACLDIGQDGVDIAVERVAPAACAGRAEGDDVARFDLEHVDLAEAAFARASLVHGQRAGQAGLAARLAPGPEQQPFHAAAEHVGAWGEDAEAHEPHWVCRRLIFVSYAATASVSRAA